jgi:hypothetical protein
MPVKSGEGMLPLLMPRRMYGQTLNNARISPDGGCPTFCKLTFDARKLTSAPKRRRGDHGLVLDMDLEQGSVAA